MVDTIHIVVLIEKNHTCLIYNPTVYVTVHVTINRGKFSLREKKEQ